MPFSAFGMDYSFFGFLWLPAGLLLASSLPVAAATGVTPILPLGFFFDWNDPQQAVPIPVTQQCDTNHIKWSRGAATGPNPVAPYFLQIFTSNSTVPFVVQAGDQLSFDFMVPFAPGTQYQICMYDKFGTTGGCQATYTVIPSPNPTLPDGCKNLTSVRELTVDAQVDTGPLSRFGFIDQCTDISVRPKDGVPPYTFTVAPPLHPPYNITSFDMSPINWTVSLNWAMPFFIGLSDSNGSMWSAGPLHAGSGGTIGCLAGNATSSHKIGVPLAVGITFIMLIFGIMAGVGGSFAFVANRKRKFDNFVQLPDGVYGQNGGLETQASQRRPRPFPLQEEQEQTANQAHNQVYVLHHDSNMAPVTIIHQEGTDVVELPPIYQSQSEAQHGERLDVTPTPSRSVSASSRGPVEMTDRERTESQRHYNPGGPWLRQPRRPNGIRKPSDPGPP